jgi:hypothetical protein
MGAPTIRTREADNTYVPQVEQGMILGFLCRSQRGPTSESEGGPVDLKSSADVSRQLGLATASIDAADMINYVIGKGAEVRAVVVRGTGSAVATVTLLDAGGIACLEIRAKNPGLWGNNLTVTITDDPSDAVNFYKITVAYSTQTELAESYDHASMDSTQKYYVEYLVNDVSNLLIVNRLTANRPANIAAQALTGGLDGTAPVAADYQAAWTLFDGDQELTHFSFDSDDGEVWSDAVDYADVRDDAVVIHGIPRLLTAAQGVSYRQGAGGYGHSDVDSSQTALFYAAPLIRLKGSYGGQPAYNKAYVLGQFAEKMVNDYPWFAVAGKHRGVIPKALGVLYNVKGKAAATTFADEEINPIIYDKPSRKTMIYDDLTCQHAVTQLRNLGVRELVNWIKRRWRYHADEILFDPNDPTSWRTLYDRMSVDLNYAAEHRGLDGYEGDGWTYVGDQDVILRQNATFNSQADLLQGKYKADLYIVPLGAIRDITLTTVLTKTSAEFTVSE